MPASMSNPKRAAALRLIGFILAAAAAMMILGPVAGFVFGILGVGGDDPIAAWLFPLLVSAALFGVT